MSKFYQITKKQAKDIGVINYANGHAFDPFVGETVNGFYLVEEQVYNLVKDLCDINVSRSKISERQNITLRTINLNQKMITNTDWKNLSQAFFYSTLMPKALQYASPNAYSTFLKVLTDGENNYASENAFLQMFNAMGITWTSAEKAEINAILTENNFTIQID
jgi:hypothetical protein